MKSEKVTLISSDGVSFKVDKADAIRSRTIKQMIDEDGAGNVFTLHNVNRCILGAVIFFLKQRFYIGGEELLMDHELEYLLGRKTTYAAAAAAAAAAVDDADRDLVEVQIKRLVAEEKRKHFDALFVMVDQNTLFDLIRAADYLDIPELLDLTKKALFDRFGWEIEIPEDICMIFDFISEREELV
ncbi:SKP1-like protein 1 [Pistacia vera]|uniref:SKP1-like protein 1 n=1 Tax=Pistacia vera TaxID=55513 RepID=UPI001263AC6D|nr:SKP1-like protein 1 [Pistacia vera]